MRSENSGTGEKRRWQGWFSVRPKLVWTMVVWAVYGLGFYGFSQSGESATAIPKFKAQRVEQEGIAVVFTLEHLDAAGKPEGIFQEGDDVVFRFEIFDTATQTPLRNAYPAGWMDLQVETDIKSGETCVAKAQSFVGGSLFAQAQLDLNVYYVVTLNDDATLSVVDPLFGFGNTKLLALVTLESPGHDWAFSEDQSVLFVSMPAVDKIAVVDTHSWKTVDHIDVGPKPSRMVRQPDGAYLWVALDGAGKNSGVAALNIASRKLVAQIPTGLGRHLIGVSPENDYVMVTNQPGSVSIIDVRSMTVADTLPTAANPQSLAHSSLSDLFLITHDGGQIAAIDGRRRDLVAQIKAEPGLGQIRFTPNGRLGFAVNPEKNTVSIIDAATNRILQTGDMEAGPDQVAFSDELAYIRHRGSDTVLMIPLAEVGVAGKPVPVIDFPGGQSPPGRMTMATPAAGIVQAPGASAVLVSNPDDKAIYFYKEGMAAPMGSFQNYGRKPRAVAVVDRSLGERASPGVYESTAALRSPGSYDLVFFMDAPRLVHCFKVAVLPNPALAAQRRQKNRVGVEHLTQKRLMAPGEKQRLYFRLGDVVAGKTLNRLPDVEVLINLAPGVWHKRYRAEIVGEGVYAVNFTPPREGVYYVYVASESQGLRLNNPQYMILEARQNQSPGPKDASKGGHRGR